MCFVQAHTKLCFADVAKKKIKFINPAKILSSVLLPAEPIKPIYTDTANRPVSAGTMLSNTIFAAILTVSATAAVAAASHSAGVDAFPQLCDAHKDVGLDFKLITAPCTCLQITAVDIFNNTASDNKTALVRVDVLCEDMRLDNVRTAFESAAKVPFTPAIAARLNEPNATDLLVYYSVVLRHVGAASLVWEGTWSFFVSDINMHDFSTSKNSTGAVESLTFDACKDLYADPTLTAQQNTLVFGNRTFSPLRKVTFLNIPEQQQPVSTNGFMLGQLGIDSPPLPSVVVDRTGRLPSRKCIFCLDNVATLIVVNLQTM